MADARDGLVEQFGFTVEQADAIVEMRLRQLTGLERDKLQAEYDELEKLIDYYQQVLGSEAMQLGIIKDELQELKEKYGDPRRSEIALSAEDFNPEDFYPNEDVVITISHYGYIKRTSLSEYRSQSRGGIGAKGSTTRDEDFIEHIYVANMHSTLMFFTQSGKCFWLKVYEIPEGAKASKGRAIQNILPLTQEDRIQAYLNVQDLDDKEFTNSHYVVLATSNGTIKKTLLEAYSRPRANGIIAVNLREGDALIGAALTSGNCEILLAGNQGKCCRFDEEEARAIGRNSTGVRGIDLEEDDYVVGMVCIDPEEQALKPQDILVVSENGFGKRSDLEEYRKTHRGSKGVKTINITDKTGKLIALKAVSDENDLMIINRSGVTIRMPADSIRVAGRATQGVKLISIREGDSIAAVCVVSKEEETESPELPENNENNTETENNNQ